MHMFIKGCSLSMFHRSCEKLHGGVRLGRLGMPNFLCMAIYFKPMGVQHNPTLNRNLGKFNLHHI